MGTKLKIKNFKCRNCNCFPEAYYEDIQRIQNECNVGRKRCDIKKINLESLPHRKTEMQKATEQYLKFPTTPNRSVEGDEFEDELPLHKPSWNAQSDEWVPCDCVTCVHEVQKRINRGYKWEIKDGIMMFERDDVCSIEWMDMPSVHEHGTLCECKTCEYEKEKFGTTNSKKPEDTGFVEKEYPGPVEYVISKKGVKEMIVRK